MPVRSSDDIRPGRPRSVAMGRPGTDSDLVASPAVLGDSSRRDDEACAAALARIRRLRPLVQCLTNTVVMNDTANAILALGAVPTMSVAHDEIAEFVARADAVVINIGTLDPARRLAIEGAVETATALGKPWVLDPVLADVSATRCHAARELMRQGPAVVRGNALELAALADGLGVRDATQLAETTGVVVAETGEVDRVTDGARWLSIANGHPLMARVTGVGCLATAAVATFAAVEDSPWRAAVDGLLGMGVAGELAGRDCPGPGTFRGRLLDCLYRLDAHVLSAAARVQQGECPSPGEARRSDPEGLR